MQPSAPAPHPVLDYSATLRARASALGLDSPDEHWLGWRVPHRFVCAQGHEVLRTPKAVMATTVACTVCAGMERLAGLHALAAAAGAICLDTAWAGFFGPYRFKCAQGHEWEHSAALVSCLRCLSSRRRIDRRSKDGLERLIAKARERGGECLSEAYLGTMQTHRFRCANGHEWDTKAGVVLNGKWCLPCGRQVMKENMRAPDGLARLQQAAAARGGVCLSPSYEGVMKLYRMRCAQGHEWAVSGAQVFKGTWCGLCHWERLAVSNRDPEGLQRLQAAAAARGGECLSDAYLGRQQPYRFRCANGHEWETKADGVLTGDWCRPCGRQAMKENMRAPDGLARLQQAAAARGGVCLSSSYEGVTKRYRMRCAKGHEWDGKGASVLQGVWCAVCDRESRPGRNRDPDGLERLQAAAAARGGECLSDAYLGRQQPYRFRCANGHEWETKADGVLTGDWCRPCGRQAMKKNMRDPDGLARLQQAAAARGGVCLSSSYEGVMTFYRMRCDKGHEWDVPGAQVFRGVWCGECHWERLAASNRDPEGLQRLQAAAAAHGGVCLNEAYLGSEHRHRFRCARGHEWEAIAGGVLTRGNWCRRCAYDAMRLGMEAAHEMAHARGGKCLSEVELVSKARLTWECHRGHVWQTRFQIVRNGHWCPECAHMDKITNKNSKARRRYEVSG